MTTLIQNALQRTRPTTSASPRSTRLPAILSRLGSFEIARSKALPVAIALTLIAGVGDAVTTADATFTLFYLVPLAIAVWYRSLGAGYVIIGLILICGIMLDMRFSTRQLGWTFVAWNTVMDAGLFATFAYVLSTLRERMNLEVHLRTLAIDQLRHAERLTTIGKLAAGVAHELGSPLSVISGRAALIASGKLTEPDTTRSATVIVQQVERIATIIRHLLDFSRRGGTHREAVDLQKVCRETLDLLASIARQSGVEMTLCGSPAVAACNRGELQQVLSNLIANATHAMPKGGLITVTTGLATTRPPDQKGSAPREFAVVAVRDEGTGIPLDVLPQIFDPFFTTKDVGTGTGLGLSVSYGIVHDHGGFIGVDTRVGEGTTFTVYLPT